MKGKWYILALFYIAGYLPTWFGLCMILLLGVTWLRKLIHNPILILMSLICFFISSFTSPNIVIPEQDFGYYEGQIKVETNPIKDDERLRFIGATNISKISLSTENDIELYHGSTCVMKGDIQLPEPPTNPGQFNYQTYLAYQGILYVSYQAEVTECSGRSLVSYLYQFRDDIRENLIELLEPDTYKWINALFFGERNDLPKPLIEAFQFWGLSHLLAISGLHVGILLGICYFVLNKVLHLTNEQSKMILLTIVPIYIFLAGAQPPVMRAGIMAVLVIIFSFIRSHKVDTTDLLSMVFMALLLIDPYLLYQLSFQFSFAVTLSLILSKKLLEKQNWLMTSLMVSLISQLVILPLQFYYFYYTNVLSFVMNLIYVPYFTLIVIPILMLVLLCALIFPSGLIFLETIFSYVHSRMMTLILSAGQPEFAQWVVGKPEYSLMILYAFIFLWFMNTWEGQRLKRAALLAILMVSIWYIPLVQKYFNQDLTVTMLDVGQAESIVIELPHNQGVYVIDVGEEMSLSNSEEHLNFERIIKPFLWSEGRGAVNALFISHFDHDHAASLQPFVKTFKPEAIYTHPFKSINHANHIKLQAGMKLIAGKVLIEVLSPSYENVEIDENNRSLVFLLTYEDFNILFTGDVTGDIEATLISENRLQDVDVLKVAHHGSKTSTTDVWIDTIQPEITLISVGRKNRYGHPDPMVIERLEQRGIEILRTDLQGAITLKYANGQGTLSKVKP